MMLRKKKIPVENHHYDVSYKVILIGDAAVGKTSILKSLNKEHVNDLYIPTIAFDFINFYHKIDNTIVRLQIW
jgi:GTPase SAR1 family protein